MPTINHKFLLYLFEGAFLKRWNDQIRTVDFRELDKQSQKFIIAYLIAKRTQGKDFDWRQLIEAGIFEFLQRLTLTDIKPALFHRITRDKKTYAELIKHSIKELKPLFEDKTYLKDYERYFQQKQKKPTLYQRIMDAANFMASREEFEILKAHNPGGFGIKEIDAKLAANIRDAQKMIPGIENVEGNKKLRDFIKVCGQLRWQIRWSHTYRVPETSVLGHMLVVAIVTHLLRRNDGVDPVVMYNDFYTALFHDLPEALTMDVIRPIKEVGQMKKLIKKYERREMNTKVYPLLPPDIKKDIRFFTESEFTVEKRRGKIIRNGNLIKAVDHLSAYLEAYLALQNGVQNYWLSLARKDLSGMYTSKIVCGVDFGGLYRSLEETFT